MTGKLAIAELAQAARDLEMHSTKVEELTAKRATLVEEIAGIDAELATSEAAVATVRTTVLDLSVKLSAKR